MIALILKSTVVLALTGMAALLLRRQSASLVHRVWMAGLLAAMAIPVIDRLVPEWGIAIAPVLDALPFSGRDQPGGTNLLSPAIVGYVWIAGVIFGLGFMLAGTLRLARLVYDAEPLNDPRWTATARDIGSRLRLMRPVTLLQSANVRFLGTWGIWRPRIIVPAAARGWSDERVRAVLAHELAHVARGDWPVQVLAEAARAIYWFNPLFWILASRLRQESEHAADNVVLGLGIGQADYARELLEISQFLGAHARQGPMLAVAQPSFLERRLVAVLNPKLRRVAAAPWATLVIILLAIGVSLPLATVREQSASPTTAGADLPEAVAAAADCPVTPTVSETPPDSDLALTFGSGPWHVNDDRSIWVWAQPYVAGQSVSAIWIRPVGSQLAIDAERTDGDAPTVEARFNCCGTLLFKSGGIRFPTPGCWRVNATAGDRRLTFVTEVIR